MQTAEKLRPFGARDKIGYAMGDLGCNLSFQLISSYMFLFYTRADDDKLGMDHCGIENLGCGQRHYHRRHGRSAQAQ